MGVDSAWRTAMNIVMDIFSNAAFYLIEYSTAKGKVDFDNFTNIDEIFSSIKISPSKAEGVEPPSKIEFR